MRWGQKLGLDSSMNVVTPVWGDGTLWGAADAITRSLTWAIEIDWDNDGAFDGSNEAPYCFDISVNRGRKFFMNSNGTGFQSVDVGQATIQLTNESGRFDPYNPSSPLFGLLLPGRRFRIRVQRESDLTLKEIFVGYVVDIRPSYSDVDTVVITAQDDVQTLKDAKVKSGVYSTIRYNTAIENVLALANWKRGSSIDSVVSDAMPFYWAGNENSAFDEIQDLANAALGLFFIDNSGRAIYLDRLNSPASIATITDDDWMRDYGVRVPMPWEVVKNNIRIYARARTSVAAVEIWRLSDIPNIPAGTSITVWATFSYNSISVPATVVTTPVVTTDYTGSVSSADLSIVMTSYATVARLVITNNNAADQTLTLMKLRGTVIVADEYSFAEDSDDDSITLYGQRYFEIKTDWLQSLNSAIDQIDILLLRLASPKQFPRLKLRGNPTKQFEFDLFDIATLNLDSRAINNDLRVGYIEYKTVSRNLDLVDTILYFEPNLASQTTGTWIFPATFGLTTVF